MFPEYQTALRSVPLVCVFFDTRLRQSSIFCIQIAKRSNPAHQLDNYLQVTRQSHLLRWEILQAGPLHHVTHYATAYCKFSFLTSHVYGIDVGISGQSSDWSRARDDQGRCQASCRKPSSRLFESYMSQIPFTVLLISSPQCFRMRSHVHIQNSL